MVLEQLPRGKLPHNSKTNPKPNSNPSREAIFFGGNCLVAPNPKTNPDLETNPNPNRGGAIFLGAEGGGGNCPDTMSSCSLTRIDFSMKYLKNKKLADVAPRVVLGIPVQVSIEWNLRSPTDHINF